MHSQVACEDQPNDLEQGCRGFYQLQQESYPKRFETEGKAKLGLSHTHIDPR